MAVVTPQPLLPEDGLKEEEECLLSEQCSAPGEEFMSLISKAKPERDLREPHPKPGGCIRTGE